METPSDVTWEDVEAVCKVMGEDMVYIRRLDEESYAVYRFGGIATVFTDPTAALEFISADKHPIEKKHANILRTKL